MLFLFRKIHRKLLIGYKITTYLLYAVMPREELKKMKPDCRLINVCALKIDEILLNIIYQYHGESTFGMMEAQNLTTKTQ